MICAGSYEFERLPKSEEFDLQYVFEREYLFSVLEQVGKLSVHSGRVSLGGVFLARSIGITTKDVKYDAHKQALDAMLTSTVDDLYALEDPGVQVIK
jgi:hypothetical protein